MCGIAGVFGGGASGVVAAAMAGALAHRGPDGEGAWADEAAGVAFGHRRLAVIDLSPHGGQPMRSGDGRWVIAYNGEVYNAAELGTELRRCGIAFRGHSDTEVILEAVAVWGVEAALKRLVGMFALALWDAGERTLYLVRDRLGIKPLYWGRCGGLLLFGSELKALRAHPGWHPRINRAAIAAFLRHNYIPAPLTIYDDAFKLPPGCVLTVKDGEEPRGMPYWALSSVVEENRDRPFDCSDDEATAALDELLRDAVGRRMVADVPLGAFLSGGIDSSTVVALMQAQSSTPVHSFSIGFHEAGFNEAQHAAAVAKYLGTEHTELYVTPAEARAVIPKLAEIHDEPFADSSQIPTYLVSELTRRHVTVALSGDGGDECFAGYTRYFLAERIRRLQGMAPKVVRNAAAAMVRSIPPVYLDGVAAMLPGSLRPSRFGDRLHKLAGVLVEEGDDFYRRLISHWTEPEQVIPGATEPKGIVWDPSVRALVPEFIDRMRYLDLLTYLPDDILTKVDRASMAVSLEARVPLLDHRVVEFAWRLPMRLKVRNGQGKWLLRRVLSKYVPAKLIERPKMGFGVPIDSWLRGPLRDWAEALLDESRLRREGYFNPAPIREKWTEHLSGRRNWQYLLWDILMFQAWLGRWG